MSRSNLHSYRALMNELVAARAAEGGTLPVEVESTYAERLNDLWWLLSDEEQTEYENGAPR